MITNSFFVHESLTTLNSDDSIKKIVAGIKIKVTILGSNMPYGAVEKQTIFYHNVQITSLSLIPLKKTTN